MFPLPLSVYLKDFTSSVQSYCSPECCPGPFLLPESSLLCPFGPVNISVSHGPFIQLIYWLYKCWYYRSSVKNLINYLIIYRMIQFSYYKNLYIQKGQMQNASVLKFVRCTTKIKLLRCIRMEVARSFQVSGFQLTVQV